MIKGLGSYKYWSVGLYYHSYIMGRGPEYKYRLVRLYLGGVLEYKYRGQLYYI